MKNIRYVIVALAVAFTALAGRAEFRWGPTAGVSITTLDFKQDLFKVDRSVGPAVGVMGEMMFPGIGFGIDIGALYSTQGATLHLGDRKIWAVDGYGTERSYLHMVQIPIDLRFKWTRMNGFEDTLAPYVFGGPTISILAGHNNLKALDYTAGSIGLQCGVGVELFRHWQLQGQYTWGMTFATKMAKLVDDSARTDFWQIRVTYLF